MLAYVTNTPKPELVLIVLAVLVHVPTAADVAYDFKPIIF